MQVGRRFDFNSRGNESFIRIFLHLRDLFRESLKELFDPDVNERAVIIRGRTDYSDTEATHTIGVVVRSRDIVAETFLGSKGIENWFPHQVTQQVQSAKGPDIAWSGLIVVSN